MAKQKRRRRGSGVRVEEVSTGSRPIGGVGTSVAGFVGFAEAGPVRTAFRVLAVAAVVAAVVWAVRGRSV